MRQFAGEQIARIGQAVEIVDIDRGAEPGFGRLVAHRHRPGAKDHPAIDSVVTHDLRAGLPARRGLAREPARRGHFFQIVGVDQGGEIDRRQIVGAAEFEERLVGVVDVARRIRRPGIDREMLGELADPLFAAAEVGVGGARLPLESQPPHHRFGEHAQPLQLKLGQPLGARLEIDRAQGAQRSALARNQRGAGVEADPRLAGDQRVFGEPWILRCVGHHKRGGFEHRMTAETGRARGFALSEAGAREEPLALFLDHGDQRDGNAAQLRGEFDDLDEFGIVLDRFDSMRGDHPGTVALFRSRGIGGFATGPEGKSCHRHGAAGP